MPAPIIPLKPITVFDDNVRPALLMLDVYKILKTDAGPIESGALLDQIRALIGSHAEEVLMLLQSEMFVGVIRERADVTKGRLKPLVLSNLLRQSVVCSATALETYLPLLLRLYLPNAIRLTKRDFLSGKKAAADWVKDVVFNLTDILDIWGLEADDMAIRLTDKIMGTRYFEWVT